MSELSAFTTVFGHGLLEELKDISAPSTIMVTMRDLMGMFQEKFPKEGDPDAFVVYYVDSLEAADLKRDIEKLEDAHGKIRSIIGFGGGQAIDVAKFFSWSLGGVALYQVPTALTVDAPWGHRAAIRYDGVVRYVGFAVPLAVYIDFDVIRSAPKRLNLSGVADVLCYHTAHWDWKHADSLGKAGKWKYDEKRVEEAQAVMQRMLDNLDDCRDMTEKGVQVLSTAFMYGGGAFFSFGWNPRFLEGFDHLFFYALEKHTGKHFIHGYPVALGIFIGSKLQDNKPEFVLDVLVKCGIDIRPEKVMQITWQDVVDTLRGLSKFVEENDYMYTIGSSATYSEEWLEETRKELYAALSVLD